MKKNKQDRKAYLIREHHRQKRADGAGIRSRRASRSIFKKRNPSTYTANPLGFQIPSNTEVIRIPRRFSFLEDPDTATAVIEQIEDAVRNPKIRFLTIDHRRCEHLDLCASALMDTALLRARDRRKYEQNALIISGKLSNKSIRVNTMLAAAGLPHRLKLPAYEVPAELKNIFKVFDMREGTASHNDSSKQRNSCGTALTEYFNECLKSKGYELTEIAQNRIGCLITEVIGNAEEHGGAWHATGFWDGSQGEGTGNCHIVIFNSGASIFESILRPDSSEDLRSKLERKTQEHTVQGNFNKNWNKECLWTVYALQDKVSRFTGLPNGKGRGNGTVDMIEFFDDLAAPEHKKMCIVSGGVGIQFDGKYRLSQDSDGLKTIAFNDSNDLSKPPNPNYVTPLNLPYRGTMVSIRLEIDAQHLQKAVHVIQAAAADNHGND